MTLDWIECERQVILATQCAIREGARFWCLATELDYPPPPWLFRQVDPNRVKPTHTGRRMKLWKGPSQAPAEQGPEEPQDELEEPEAAPGA